jgi:uncharacterized protein YxeA
MEGWMTDVFYLKILRVGVSIPCKDRRHRPIVGYKATIRGYDWNEDKRCYEFVCSCNRRYEGTLSGGFKEADDDRYPMA